MEVSVIIPMYNEEENVNRTLKTIEDILSSYDYEILVVDDGSVDNTLKIAEEYASKNSKIRILKHKTNIGRGKALRTGFKNSKGNIIVSIDADLSFDPIFIPHMINELEKDKAIDIIIGSQYMKGGKTENIPFHRLLISKLANKIVGYSINGNLSTVTGVFRAYRKEVFDSLELTSDDKEIHLEILSKAIALGFKINEIPVTLKNRKFGNSKMQFRATTISHLFFTFYEKPMVLFGFIGFFLCFIGFITGLYLFYLYLNQDLNPERPLMILMTLMILGGIQIIVFGFVATQISLLNREIYLIQKENKLLRKDINNKL